VILCAVSFFYVAYFSSILPQTLRRHMEMVIEGVLKARDQTVKREYVFFEHISQTIKSSNSFSA